jgi:hypothetical protein
MAGFHPPITGRFCPPGDSETSGDEIAVLGPKLPNAPGVLLGFLGDIGQFFRGKNLSDVLNEVVQETFLASHIAPSDSIC